MATVTSNADPGGQCIPGIMSRPEKLVHWVYRDSGGHVYCSLGDGSDTFHPGFLCRFRVPSATQRIDFVEAIEGEDGDVHGVREWCRRVRGGR
jgi:hypothetical protein